jgi:hypothetical protein
VAAVITPVGRLSYPHLDKAQAAQEEGQKDKFGATLVFAKGTDLKALEAEARAVAVDALGEKKGAAFALYGGKGAAFRTDNADKYPSIEGAITIGARNEKQPGLVYRHVDPKTIVDGKGKPARVAQEDIEEVFYPGAEVKAQLKPYWYDKKGNKGIGWALNNVQKWADAERLDSRQKAEDAFDADMSVEPDGLEDLVGSNS